MKRARIPVILAIAALFAPAAPARANHVQCGDTITESTKLDSDVVCADDFRGTAVWIAADNVTLNLAGHAVRKAENPFVSSNGIDSTEPLSGVDIRNGTVSGFHVGVNLRGVDHAVRRLHVKALDYGIVTDYDGVESTGKAGCERRFRGSLCIQRNLVETGVDGVGIGVDSARDAGAHVWNNTVRGPAHSGIIVGGDDTRTVLNTVETCYPYPVSPKGFGIEVLGYLTKAVVALNTITSCAGDAVGINVVAYQPQSGCGAFCTPGRGAQVRRNVVQGNSTVAGSYGHGLFVADPDAIVAINTASNYAGSGIVVASAGYESEPVFGPNSTLIAQNAANDNRLFGIYAPYAKDGGGNTATGNGDTNCVGVTC